MARTITKAEYLKLCVSKLEGITKKNWYVCAFTLPMWKDTVLSSRDEEFDLVIMNDGLHTLLMEEDALVLVKISDHKKDSPLFSWQDTVSIDNTWLPNVTGKIETVLGRLLINAIVFVKTCGDRIPFLNKPKFSVGDIEFEVISRTKNKEDMKQGSLSVREMVSCIDGLNFFVFVSTFTSIAATPKTISAPPGAHAYRDKLLKEYGEELKNPVKLAEFEDKLANFDAEYLKDDPAAAAIFGSKSRASRMKSHYFYGEGLDFIDSKDNDRIVRQSLGEGIEAKPEELAKHFNDLRFASYSRGGSTALAGYAYKILQRSLSGISISNKPCNTTKGLVRVLTERQAKGFTGRSYLSGGKWKTVETSEEALALKGKTLTVRSTMYCTSPKDSVCYACMNLSYKDNESAVTNIAATISGIFLNAFLKLMHSSVTQVRVIEIEDMIS